ncbi:MAG: carbohydrate binding domain-containing protein, partial [Armatimonadota bacterium]
HFPHAVLDHLHRTCRPEGTAPPNAVFQTSTISALLGGIYDGTMTNTIYGKHLPEGPHYILLNSGVESARPPREGTTFPNDFVVDYVRVYARPDVPALLNSGFEDAELKPWDRVNESAAVDYGARTGRRSLRIDGSASGEKAASYAQQTVQGLKPNTRYTLSGYARTEGIASARLGVK